MQKKTVFLAIVPLALAAIAIAVFLSQPQHEQGDDQTLHLYGNVAIREAQLAFNSSEHIAEIHVQEGDRVSKGQLLAHLHTELLEAQRDEVQAALLAQQQVLAKLEAGSRPQEIRKAQAELKAARATAKAAVDSYKRKAQLLERKLASPEDVENARSLADAAAARMEAAQQALALLQAGPRKEDIAVARAQLVAREAGLVLARQRLEDANLYAPADGIIRNRILEPGAMAFPQTPVLTLAFINPVWVRAYLPEPALGQVALGAKALIHTDSYPDKVYQGWVGYISPSAEFTPKNVQTPELRTRLVYSVRIYACNPQGELRLGMPVTVTLALDQALSSTTANRCGP
ncbi:MAG: HlyD family efflux transporter periplasmic adaptor subunit [Gammaproteobacteria bacterium]|nr:HlyD family efflux transporter periplasmic adaptor subunit [Gammaproteobacteria bacterium]